MTVIKGKIEVTTNHFHFHDLSQIREECDRNDFKVGFVCMMGPFPRLLKVNLIVVDDIE